jgi:hypothetical protein
MPKKRKKNGLGETKQLKKSKSEKLRFTQQKSTPKVNSTSLSIRKRNEKQKVIRIIFGVQSTFAKSVIVWEREFKDYELVESQMKVQKELIGKFLDKEAGNPIIRSKILEIGFRI